MFNNIATYSVVFNIPFFTLNSIYKQIWIFFVEKQVKKTKKKINCNINSLQLFSAISKIIYKIFNSF